MPSADLTFHLQPGREAASAAASVWTSLPEKMRRACLFDVPCSDRGAALSEAWRNASHVCAANLRGRAVAWSWTMHIGKDTAACHFILPPLSPDLQLAIVGGFLSFRLYAAYVCLVPCRYFGIRSLLSAAGFRLLATLPGASFIWLHKRHVDGCLYLYEEGK